ncbi:MAG: AgmX/PglI C-terminal domain-containing protein [Polyangiaceae bacterium]|nr:AgmX/PglI C-terminal domain-containing protein [Polyangiaceae bacterium]
MKTLPRILVPMVLPVAAACGGGPAPAAPGAGGDPPTASAAPRAERDPDRDEAPPVEASASPAAPASAAPPAASASAGAAATPPGSDQTETRTTAVLQKIVQDHRKPIRACFDAAREGTPNLRGALVVRFVLDAEGKVKTAELVADKSDIRLPKAVDCVLAEIRKLPFPPSSRGMDTTVVYPFDFKP